MIGSRDWVKRIEERVQKGRKNPPRLAVKMAEEVAGRSFFPEGKPKHRPDAGDRAAADTSWEEGMVEF